MPRPASRRVTQPDAPKLVFVFEIERKFARHDTIARMPSGRHGPEVPFEEFYLRSSPSFETEEGPHAWLMRHIFVGIGTHQRDVDTIRCHALV